MKIIEKNKTKIFSWVKNPETETLTQMDKVANLPFVEHCALMPDAHPGYSLPIGGVAATKDVIVPAFVGFDIACSMMACKTDIKKSVLNKENKRDILQKIERRIPLGFAHNSQHRKRLFKENHFQKFLYSYNKNKIEECENTPFEMDKQFSKIDNMANIYFNSIGTLGSGNHFIEIQHDENDDIWIMIHSGSRNLGYKICEYFDKKAKEQCDLWHSKSDIAFLPVCSQLGKEYVSWMNFCMDFSYQNKKLMMIDIQEVLKKFFNCNFDKEISVFHNYASVENHMGKNVWVHRKGATPTKKGVLGIVPGSMNTNSYIIEGKDSTESILALNSCSHGAGRKCSRKAFNIMANKDQTSIDAVLKSVEGVVHSKFKKAMRGRKEVGGMDYSETPEAYKDIYDVMRNQKELIDVVHTLRPLICVKG